MIIAETKLIKWRCRRSMLELDILLQKIILKDFDNLPFTSQEFLKFLSEDDVSLEQWLIKSPKTAPTQYYDICKIILDNVTI